jgi:acetyltransferase-like isoleucine patch superfamily enzyme
VLSESIVDIADSAIVDDSVVLGYPSARCDAELLTVGDDTHVRSGSVIYAGSSIGRRLQTGHNVVIREQVRIGDDVSIWSNSVVDYGCVIGDRVKIHSNCYIAQYTELECDVFLAPGVIVANDLYPGNRASGDAMAGPLIREGAQIGVNVTLLPYITIGRGAIIGAGAVVTRDVPDGMIAYGNPAAVVRPVPDTRYVEARVRPARDSRLGDSSTNGSRSPIRT